MAGISKKKIKTKNGTIIKYTITYYDIFGSQHTSGIYGTQKEAKRALKSFNKEKTDTSKITYGFIFKNYLNKVQRKNTQGTYINYLAYYSKHFQKFDDIEYEKITSLYWQEFFDNLEKKKSPYVAQHCLKMCKAAINLLIKHDVLEKNIFNKIEKIILPKPDINHLTIEELKNVLEECKRSYREYYPLLFTFVGTGAREGEIFALTKNDFNYREKTITINKQYTKRKLLPHPKTASSNRKIYLFDELANVINEHIKTLDKTNDLLFPNKKGSYLDASNFRERVFYKLLKLCKITKRVRLHDLRGSYTDMTLSSGLSVKFTQNQLGHAKTETTMNIYARNNQDMIQNAQNTINNIFQKYEQNESKKLNYPPPKIIHFPQNRTTQA